VLRAAGCRVCEAIAKSHLVPVRFHGQRAWFVSLVLGRAPNMPRASSLTFKGVGKHGLWGAA
jgi:hypothetical protein